MKVQVTIDVPDEDGDDMRSEADYLKRLKFSFQSAFDHHWKYAPMGTYRVEKVEPKDG